LAVFLLHAGGFFLGYVFAWLLRYDKINCRTISIEVGMQNSGLGATLAKEHFAQMPLTPLPCAISATFHSVIGKYSRGHLAVALAFARLPSPRSFDATSRRDKWRCGKLNLMSSKKFVTRWHPLNRKNSDGLDKQTVLISALHKSGFNQSIAGCGLWHRTAWWF